MGAAGEPTLTRFTTAEERANIVGVDLDAGDVTHFMDLVEKGLVSAAAEHEAAVQNDMALSAEVTIRLSRPVRADDGQVAEVVGREIVTGRVTARKVYADPDKAPVTED
jgi:hypothetical protein